MQYPERQTRDSRCWRRSMKWE